MRDEWQDKGSCSTIDGGAGGWVGKQRPARMHVCCPCLPHLLPAAAALPPLRLARGVLALQDLDAPGGHAVVGACCCRLMFEETQPAVGSKRKQGEQEV